MTDEYRSRQEIAWSCAIVFCLQIFLLYPALNIYLSGLGDEGYTLSSATRMAGGEIPYRDYFSRLTPATDFLLSLFYRGCGFHILVGRVYFLLMSALLAAAIQFFSCRLLPRIWSEMPAFCFLALGAQAWPMASFHWDSNIFALATLILVSRQSSPKVRPQLAGAMAGLTLLFLQTKGIAAIGAVAISLLLEQAPFKVRLANLGKAALGGLAVGLPFTVWLMLEGALKEFFQQTVGFNSSNYVAMQQRGFDLSPLAQEFSVIVDGISKFGQTEKLAWLSWFGRALAFLWVDVIKFGGYYPVVLIGALLAARTARRGINSDRERLFVSLMIALSFTSLFDAVRPNRYHLSFQTPLWYPALFYLLWRLQKRVSLLLPALILLGFAIHGLDNYFSWDKYQYPINFPRGTVKAENPRLAGETQALVNLLASQFPPSTTGFGFPDIPLLVWLLGYSNPTHYPHAVPLLYSPQELQTIQTQLQRERVQCLIFAPVDPSAVNGDYPLVRPEDFAQKQDELCALLTQGYQLVARSPAFSVYRLKSN